MSELRFLAPCFNPSSDATLNFASAASASFQRNTPFEPQPVTATRTSEPFFATQTPTSA